MKMNKLQLKQYLISQYEIKFSGWDFSYLDGKMEESPLPWNYRNIITEYMKTSSCMLDMGTGGGEFLDSLEELPKLIYATEGYAPNIPIAQNRLKHKNIEVKAIDETNILPFDNASFDVVINRHEEYIVDEVKRVLKENGYFVTQQVGGMNNIDINSTLGAIPPHYYNWCLLKTIEDLTNAGFKIVISDETIGYSRFYDIGSIVYYLKCIPWQIDDFSVEKYFDRLYLLDEYIKEHKYKDFINHRFYVVAQRIR